MGSRGSGFEQRNENSVNVDLYKAIDEAFDKAYSSSWQVNLAAEDEYDNLVAQLQKKGLADDYYAWLDAGHPDHWIGK